MHAPRGEQARGAYYKALRGCMALVIPILMGVLEGNKEWVMFVPVIMAIGKAIRIKWPKSAPWVPI